MDRLALSRREMLMGAAVSALLPVVNASVAFSATMDGSAGSPPSQRSIANWLSIGGIGSSDYAFINHLIFYPGGIGPSGTSLTRPTEPTWMQSIGPDGYPNVALTQTNPRWGGGCYLPDSSNYGATGSGHYYVLTWDGDGSWSTPQANSSSFFDVNNKLSRGKYSKTGNGRFAGTNPKIVFNFNGTNHGLPMLISWAVDVAGNGSMKNIRLYRLDDEADILAGKIFRASYLKWIAKLNPSAIRFMDAQGGNSHGQIRFEDRTLPSNSAYSGNWVSSPAYGATSYSGTPNRITLAAVTKGRRTTPAAMQHGERVSCLVANSAVRPVYLGYGGQFGRPVTAITNANPARVTCASHGFVTGDVCQFQMPKGMTNLHYATYAVTVLDANNFTIEIDTRSYPRFNPTSAAVWQYVSLSVGARGAFPVALKAPQVPITGYGGNLGGNMTFVFDKTVAALQDGAGNWIYGVWLAYLEMAECPLEIMTKFVNELQAIYDEQGFGGPTHLWCNIGSMAMLSCDAALGAGSDYSDSSNWAKGAVDIILNGANGFAGLDRRCNIFFEFSNECWNTANLDFSQSSLMIWKAHQRWGTTNDTISMTQLRSVYMAEDIKAASNNNPRVKFVLGGWANNSGSRWGNSGNSLRALGTKQFLSDPLNKWGSATSPISHHDYFAIAPYLTVPDGYWTDASSKGFAADAAGWNATIGNPTAQENYVNNFITQVDVTSGQAGSFYYNAQIANHAAALGAIIDARSPNGKVLIQYEGGPDWPLSGQAYSHTIAATETAFIAAVTDSPQWATAWTGYLSTWAKNAASAMPAMFQLISTRWTWVPKNIPLRIAQSAETVDYYSQGVEGGAFSQAFLATCGYNTGKP